MRSLLTALFVSGFVYCFSQRIENIKASFQDGKVIVLYELNGANPTQKFSVEIFCSHNNFSSALAKVSGDVGKDIAPGAGKKIVWNVEDELGEFKGEISFRIKGSEIIAPFVFKTPLEGNSIRRGKKTELKWEGGSANQNIKLDLYKGTEHISTVVETKNSGQYTWSVPKDLSKGSYTLKLDGGQSNVTTGVFQVKSKIPLLLKAFPILGLGGLAVALGGGGGGGSANNDLPAAPNPK